jgi:CBS domain containing-hemolysin-like protein
MDMPVLVDIGAVSRVPGQHRQRDWRSFNHRPRRSLSSEVDTLGGLVFARLERRPCVGDVVDLGGDYQATVVALDGLRVASVRLLKRAAHSVDEAT